MAEFKIYAAASTDGYIADREGGVGWLDPFNEADYGYEVFLAGIGAIVMGRKTADQVFSFGEWPYGGVPTVIWSSLELQELPDGVKAFSGPVDELAARLEELAGEKDIWILGGGTVNCAFLEAGLVDSMEIFIMPVLLGGGIKLFGRSRFEGKLELKSSETYDNGVVRVVYSVVQ
jgi:dihydrofolate reductase